MEEKLAVNDNKPLNYQHKTQIKTPKIDTFLLKYVWLWVFFSLSLLSSPFIDTVIFNQHFVVAAFCCSFIYKSVSNWITNESMAISSSLSLLLFRQTWKKSLNCFIERQWLQQMHNISIHHIYICIAIKMWNGFCIFISDSVD